MKRLVTSIALCLPTTNVASAQPLMLTEPSFSIARGQRIVHVERMAALGLAIVGGVFATTAGVLMGKFSDHDGALGSGIALTTAGGAAALAAMYTVVYAAGQEAGLRRLRLVENATAQGQLVAIDSADARARRNEYIGIGLLVTGLAMFGAGCGMAFAGLGTPLEGSGQSGNTALFVSGVLISVLGDGAWFSGSVVSTYYGAQHNGLRQARRALRFGPTGAAGTF